jgi:hypothetical protein
MSNIKDLLIKKVKSYKLGDICSKDAERLRHGMIELINNTSIEKVDEILDHYLNNLYELCEFDSFEEMTTITQITNYFKDLKPYLGESAVDIFNAQTSFVIKKYEENEPLFVAVVDSIHEIVNMEDDNYKNALICDLTFFMEKVIEVIEEETD